MRIQSFEKFNESTEIDSRYYIHVGEELSKLLGDTVRLEQYLPEKYSRSITYTLPSGAEMHIEQNWRGDGSPTKPVTTIQIYPDTFLKLGRFAIWPSAKDYAEDIYNIIKEKI